MGVTPAERIDIPAELPALVALGEQVERFAEANGLPGSTLFAVQLCLEEAVSNVIRHAVLPAGARIGVTLERAAGELVVSITDAGPPFDPLAAAAPAPHESLESAAIGGQGIVLMRRFCHDMRYQHVGGLNRLRLAFPLESAST